MTKEERLREALDLALQLPTWAIKSEESSSAHHHGPRAAERYDRKVQDALAKISEARDALDSPGNPTHPDGAA